MMLKCFLKGMTLSLFLFPQASVSQQMPVDMALILAVDVSSSMSTRELALQRAGYVAAISDPQVAAALTGGPLHRTALSYVEWADPGLQISTMDWRVIDSPAAAAAFAAELAAKPLTSGTNTSISSALRFSAALFDRLPMATDRRIIDISGDGPNSAGAHVAPTRDRIVDRDIVINGIAILIDPEPLDAATGTTLTEYYQDCVIGGPGAFVITASSISEMADAIRRKMVLEVAADPVSPAVVHVAAQKPADCTFGQKDFYE